MSSALSYGTRGTNEWCGTAAVLPGVCLSPLYIEKSAAARPFRSRASAERVDCATTHVIYWCQQILIDGVRPVGKTICVVATALAVFVSLSDVASADGMRVKQNARKVVAHTSVIRPACPDPYSCSSLYGAYGPYGGAAYLTRYTYSGWYR